ncbi:YnhF family membrane protein [Vibrio sp. AK197]|uniref:YnhF family membrane protein n=1 Tax=Vibrio olivae TaxID=1243002 RepID=A0ABV5HKK5_9VIBR
MQNNLKFALAIVAVAYLVIFGFGLTAIGS